MQPQSIPLKISIALAVCACNDDAAEDPLTLPICDDISWPLGVAPEIEPPAPEFAVECAHGWGNLVETRPALDTIALPYDTWDAEPHREGGWSFVVVPEHQPGWKRWLEGQGVAADSQPGGVLLRYDTKGDLGWVVLEYDIWMIEIVGDELWAIGWDQGGTAWILAFDPASGMLLDSHPWEFELQFNRLVAASDSDGGVWVTGIGDGHQGDGRVPQQLYRAITIDTPKLVATRTTDDPLYWPSGAVHALQDGAAAWQTGNGFEVVEPDGTVRWAHATGSRAASDADSMLIVSQISSQGTATGQVALGLEKVALVDGTPLWTRTHHRFEIDESADCGPQCVLIDYAYPVLRPDGGYLLVGHHAYPSNVCVGQPLILAVSAEGDAEWAHRVDTCGTAYRVAFRNDGSTLEVLGATFADTRVGAWRRLLDLRADD